MANQVLLKVYLVFNSILLSLVSFNAALSTMLTFVDIGTRRPLIIQMINNPSKDQPSCRFRKEYPPMDGESFEDHDTPLHELVDEIIKRTNDRAGVGTDKVSDVPIILRVEYCHCANLTIYDTPVTISCVLI
jgi:hypothetical protein